MKSKHDCPRCGGPADPLHTQSECDRLLEIVDLPMDAKYDIAIIANFIEGAPHPIAAAAKLYRSGWFRRP